jgi:cyanophycin synthetase
MAAASSGSVIYFSMNPDNETLRRQASRGRRSVTIETGRGGDLIVLRQGRKSLPLVYTHLIPATFEGKARMNVQNALAATAAAWAAGAHLHDIRQGLRTFATSYFQAPGRLNLFELDGYRVLVDYAHNPHAMQALGSFIDAIADDPGNGHHALVTGRRIGVVATAGDRRDRDIRELGMVAARYFDRIVIREDENRRGREPGVTAGLIREGVDAAVREGARCQKVEVVLDEMDATRRALDMGRRGDIVVLCVDHANLAWKEVQNRLHGSGDGRPAGEEDGAGSAEIEAEDFF